MDEKDQIKQKIEITELISEYVRLQKAGGNYRGLCPFHQEKSPSFFVHPEMGFYKCFGCGASGDCFTWMMEMEGMTFPEAMQNLATRVGITLSKSFSEDKSKTDSHLEEILNTTREFYHWLLTKHSIGEVARTYLKNRGISDNTIETFQLGWSPEDWDGLLRYLTQKKKFSQTNCVRSGLIIEKESGRGGYDRFRARIMYPLQNAHGQTLGFSGRTIDPEVKQAKYINTPETDLYRKRELLYGLEITKKAIKNKSCAIIVEGEMDCLSSWQAGVENVVAIKGSALTEDQIHIIKRYTQTMLLALDMDIAGDKAARTAIELADKEQMEVKVVRIPDGKDPDELARKNPDAWKRAVTESVSVYQFVLDSAIQRYGTDTGIGKQRIADEVLPIYQQINNAIVQSHWISQLSRRIDIKETILIQSMNQTKSQSRTPSHLAPDLLIKDQQPAIDRKEKLERLAVGLTFQPHSKPQNYMPRLTNLIKQESLLTILKAAQQIQSFEKVDLLIISNDLKNILAEILLEIQQMAKLPVLEKVLNELELLNLKQQQKQLRQQIIDQEQTSISQTQINRLQREFDSINFRLVQLKAKRYN